MENLLQALEIIENEHKEFFSAHNIKPTEYISISRKPVMIRFNDKADNKHQLPKKLHEKIHALIMSYYS